MGISISKSTYRAGSAFSSLDPSHLAPEAIPPIVTTTGAAPSDGGAGGAWASLGGGQYQYTPLNRTQAITMTSAGVIGSLALQVYGTLPIQPQYGYEIGTPPNTKVKLAKDMTPFFRVFPTRSATWNFGYRNRIIADVSVLKAFEFWHDINKEFYLVDPELVQQLLVRFDSDVVVRVQGGNQFEMSCLVKIYKLPSTGLVIPTAYS